MLHAIWQIIGAPIALGIDTSAVESDVQNRCQEFGKGEVNLAIPKKKKSWSRSYRTQIHWLLIAPNIIINQEEEITKNCRNV